MVFADVASQSCLQVPVGKLDVVLDEIVGQESIWGVPNEGPQNQFVRTVIVTCVCLTLWRVRSPVVKTEGLANCEG